MSDGRTSRLYRALVRDKKIASYSAGFTGLPGNKYPHLFAFYAFPMPGHTPEEMGAAIHDEIEKLKTQDISDDELKMIKTRAKANLLRSLDDNEGLAFELGMYQARYDDWRSSSARSTASTRSPRRISAAWPTKHFVANNRTVGIIETPNRRRRRTREESNENPAADGIRFRPGSASRSVCTAGVRPGDDLAEDSDSAPARIPSAGA